MVWKPYKALNCDIPGDRTQHTSLRAEDLSVSPSVTYVLVYCGTNNLDHDEPKIIDGIIKIGKVFQKNWEQTLK